MPGPEPLFSAGAEVAHLTHELSSLLAGRWSLTADRRGLERRFSFKTFKKTWEFMNIVAAECQRQKHHPEWSNVYNKTHIRWTTHQPLGLSAKDLLMAKFCDNEANKLGEILPDGDQPNGTDTLGLLTDEVGKEAGDCCKPKR